jgi:hypothetical protein
MVVDKLPAVDVDDDITFVACPDGTAAPACIRVDVYRDARARQCPADLVRQSRRRDVAGHSRDRTAEAGGAQRH